MNQIESLELKIAKFLRVGVIIAGILMLLGWLMQVRFISNPFYVFDTYDQIPFVDLVRYHIFRKNYGAILSYVGLIALICLPVIRVFLTAILFIKQQEFKLSLIALVVLVGLIFSMALGIEL
jgi:uncharacterized membrane protein